MTERATLNRGTLVDTAVFSAVGVACLSEGGRLYVTARDDGLQQELAPGFYVLLLGIVLLATGLFHLFTQLRTPPELAEAPSGTGRLGLAAIIGTLIGYALLMTLVGYFIASAVFFMAILALFRVRNWINPVLGFALAGVFHVIFVEHLDIIFPRGLLF
jgi:hypothetical protein